MMKKLHLIIKISFFAIVIAVSIFLKEKHFTAYILPATAYISPVAVSDQTDYIIQFNNFSNILLASSLLLLILFFTYYKMSVRLFDITLLDKIILFYYSVFFITIFTTYHSIYVYSGDLCHLSSILTSITFLQYDFLNVLPIGIILYIPILYLFFIKHERRKIRNEIE